MNPVPASPDRRRLGQRNPSIRNLDYAGHRCGRRSRNVLRDRFRTHVVVGAGDRTTTGTAHLGRDVQRTALNDEAGLYFSMAERYCLVTRNH